MLFSLKIGVLYSILHVPVAFRGLGDGSKGWESHPAVPPTGHFFKKLRKQRNGSDFLKGAERRTLW